MLRLPLVVLCVFIATTVISDGPQYTFHSQRKTYYVARSVCLFHGGDLVAANSASEIQTINSKIIHYQSLKGGSGTNDYWTRGQGSGSTYYWGNIRDRIPAGRSLWGAGEPNDATEYGEHCVTLKRKRTAYKDNTFHLNDERCENKFAFICEYK